LFEGRFLAASSAAAQAAAGSPFWNLAQARLVQASLKSGASLTASIQHHLRIARPLGDQEQAAIVGLERLHGLGCLSAILNSSSAASRSLKRTWRNHRKAMIGAALFR
jgi:hypothetical protein